MQKLQKKIEIIMKTHKLAFAKVDIITKDGQRIEIQFENPSQIMVSDHKIIIKAEKINFFSKISKGNDKFESQREGTKNDSSRYSN